MRSSTCDVAGRDAAANARAPPEHRGFPADRRHQPEVFQHRRAQRAGDALDGRDGQIDEPDRRLQPIDDRELGGGAERTESVDGARDLEPDAGQQLAHLVVQRAPQVAAFVFTGRLEMRGQIAQPMARQAQLLFLPLAMRDVAELPDVNDPLALERHGEVFLLEDPSVLHPQLGHRHLFAHGSS